MTHAIDTGLVCLVRVAKMMGLPVDPDQMRRAYVVDAAGIDTLSDVTSWSMTSGLADPKEALAGATPYLRIFGIVTGGWLMARQALAARAELDAGSSDSAYLEAKIVTARFYAEQQLPQAAGWVASVKGGAAVLYDVDADQLASV